MHKTITKNQQLILNLISSIVVFGINMIISFFLSPYIVKTIGIEANGFINMANDFISYATLITIAVNSMASRFITISIHQNDYEQANKYYTGVFIGNIFVLIVLFIPSFICTYYLEHIINIPPELICDVKILFALSFINFYINSGIPNWSTATFATNNIYLQSLVNLQATIVKVLIIVGMFTILNPHVYYMGIAACTISLFIGLYSYYYKMRLLPELRLGRKYFNIQIIFELIYSGMWNTITRAGQLLLNGLDLLITNLFLGTKEMGMLALAKALPNIVGNLAWTLANVFTASLTINYAKRDINAIVKELKKSMKIMGIIITIPLSLIIVYGYEFYNLWVPSQDARLLHILSILTCFGYIFIAGAQCLSNVFTVINKLKTNSLLMVSSGAVSTLIVLILLKTTDLGIYAIAGVSSSVNLIRNLLYTVPFAAKYLRFKWTTFFPEVGLSIISVFIMILVGYGVKQLFRIDSWITFFIAIIITSAIGLIINIYIVLNKEERNFLTYKIINKVLK